MARRPNDDIATRLDEIAALLDGQAANRYRVRANQRAAATLRQLAVPGVTDSGNTRRGRSRSASWYWATARSHDPRHCGPRLLPVLERLRGESDAIRLFASVPGIGYRQAARLHDELGLDTLQELEAAAHDGRLEEVAGFGSKRLTGIRDTLARRLGRIAKDGGADAEQTCPPVRELLDVDSEYLRNARDGELPLITPRRFNPARAAWLPILHTKRGGHHYTALFSNTARAHRLGKTHDWVVLYGDDGPREHQWTITSAFGPMRGRRIVTGRERNAPCCTTRRLHLRSRQHDRIVLVDPAADRFTFGSPLGLGQTVSFTRHHGELGSTHGVTHPVSFLRESSMKRRTDHADHRDHT